MPGRPEGYNQMRPKLVLISSLVALALGAGIPIVTIGITVGSFARPWFDPAFSRHANGWLEIVTFVPPVAAAVMASLFVYRHTARRRKLQAVLTFLLVLILSLAAYVALFFLNF